MLRVTGPATNRAERAYVFDVVLGRWLGLPFTYEAGERDRTVLRLHGQPGSVKVVDSLLASDVDELDALPAVDDEVWVDSGASNDFPLVDARLPVLYGPAPDQLAVVNRTVEGDGRNLEIGLDVFGTIFALLTGLEDRFVSERDEHGRVPLAPTLLARRGLNEVPVVDQLVELLWAALSTAWPQLRRRVRTSVVRVTQDVDRISKFGSRTPGHLALAVAAATTARRTDRRSDHRP